MHVWGLYSMIFPFGRVPTSVTCPRRLNKKNKNFVFYFVLYSTCTNFARALRKALSIQYSDKGIFG